MKSCTSIQVDKDIKDTLFYTKDGILYHREFLEYTRVVAYPAGKKDPIYKSPEKTWIISVGAFLGADHLQEVYLPSSLKKIYDYAFSECKNLRKVIVKNRKKIPEVSEIAFLNSPKLKEHVKDKDDW